MMMRKMPAGDVDQTSLSQAQTGTATGSGAAAGEGSAGPGPKLLARVAPFVAGVALVLLYALRGGAYDLVVFESYGLIVWWILALGILVGVLPRSRPGRAVLLLIVALLAYTVWTAISLLWSESAERTTIEIARSLDYLGLLALIAVTLDRRNWRPAAAGVGFGAGVVCLLAVGSRLFPSIFPVDQVAAAFHTDRLSYPFGYWNAVAAWGAMTAAIGLAWSAHAQSRVARGIALALVPPAVLATYLSYSRAGIGGIALAVLLVLAFSRTRLTVCLHVLAAAVGAAIPILAVRGSTQIAKASGTHGAGTVATALLCGMALCACVAGLSAVLRHGSISLPRGVRRPLAAVVAIGIVLAGTLAGPRLVSHTWRSFTRPVGTQSLDPTARLLTLSGTRYQVWKVALKTFDRKPATGTGAGTFEFSWDRHATNAESLHDTHNIWLQNMAELGLPGLLAIVAVAVLAILAGAQVRKRARRLATVGPSVAFLSAFGVFLAHASVDWMWESTAVTVLAFAGIACAGARLSQRCGRIGWPVRGSLVLFAALAAVVQLPGLLSTTEIRRSQAAQRAGNSSLALAWSNDAVSAEPWSASAYEQRGLVYEAAHEFVRGKLNLTRAIADEPTNYSHWLIRSRIETELGQLDAASRDYDRAHRLGPLAAVFSLAPR